MSLRDRIESLKAKHADLESAIEAQASSINPDTTRLNDLKRKKLRIKDELARMGAMHH